MKKWLFAVVFCVGSFMLGRSQVVFTHADTLRGSITPQRAWWDLLHYTLNVSPDIQQKTINGSVIIRFKTIKTPKLMQVDLQQPLAFDTVFQKVKNKWVRANFTRDGNAYFIQLPSTPPIGAVQEVKIAYSGKPREAVRPPWDGGISWKKDAAGNPFIATSCQGLGASVWWPCKDHQYDEPNYGALISVTTPDTLMNVSNGKLQSATKNSNGTVTWTWSVINPVNNYSISMNIGKYELMTDAYLGLKGKLPLNYYVLVPHKDSALLQFQQAKPMLQCFEFWFGPYPFYEDGYKLVEVPYLGMEHQSNVAYGNKFKNGYLGRDLSGTGWGLKWDFILVHESGHEWFGNNITSIDIADMWIHEGFTNYSETLFTEWQFGKAAGEAYNYGCRKKIRNDKPIIGTYGVHREGSGDMYYKASAMIHSIRNAMNNDTAFRRMLLSINKVFGHKTINTEMLRKEMERFTGFSLAKIFEQYLTTTQVPVLQYYFSADGKNLLYRYSNCVEGFNLPLHIASSLTPFSLTPTPSKWQSVPITDVSENQALMGALEQKYYIKLEEKKEAIIKNN